MPQIVKLSIIPYATYRKTDPLKAEVPVDIATVVLQVAGPCVWWKGALRRAPPVALGPNKNAWTIATTDAARLSCETAAIGGSGIGGKP